MPSRGAAALLFAALLTACGSSGLGFDASNAGALARHGIDVRLQLESIVVGESQTVRVYVRRYGRPVVGDVATIAWSMEGMPMSNRAQQLTQQSPGVYRQNGFVFSMPGRWHARVVAVTNGGSDLATFTIDSKE